MAEWQSSIRSYCDQGDDQWGIRSSTSRKGYLLVSLPDQQDIGFMPQFFSFPKIHWMLRTLFILYMTEVFRKCLKRYICGYIYRDLMKYLITSFHSIIFQRFNLFKSYLVVSSM